VFTFSIVALTLPRIGPVRSLRSLIVWVAASTVWTQAEDRHRKGAAQQ
jgi:hypothetical protein